MGGRVRGTRESHCIIYYKRLGPFAKLATSYKELLDPSKMINALLQFVKTLDNVCPWR
jgi:hypothetical protein